MKRCRCVLLELTVKVSDRLCALPPGDQHLRLDFNGSRKGDAEVGFLTERMVLQLFHGELVCLARVCFGSVVTSLAEFPACHPAQSREHFRRYTTPGPITAQVRGGLRKVVLCNGTADVSDNICRTVRRSGQHES